MRRSTRASCHGSPVAAGAGLARTGSVYGHGSGDLALAFSTAYTIAHDASTVSLPALVADAALDPLFMAAAESVEHAIVDALLQAVTVTGRDGHVRQSLRDAVNDLDRLFGGQDDGLPTRS